MLALTDSALARLMRGAREVLYAGTRAELHRNRLRCQNDAIPMRR